MRTIDQMADMAEEQNCPLINPPHIAQQIGRFAALQDIHMRRGEIGAARQRAIHGHRIKMKIALAQVSNRILAQQARIMHPEHRFAAMLHDIKQRLRAGRMVRRQGDDAVIADLAGFKGLHSMDDRRAIGGIFAVFRLNTCHARVFLFSQRGRHVQMPGIGILIAGGHLRGGIMIRMPVRNQDMAILAHIQAVKCLMRKHIGDVKAIEDISFKVRKGETLGIVGESGCGKTTLARCIMRVYQPDTGEIDFAGTDIAKFNDKQMYPYRKKMAMIFQDPFSSLDPRQTAESIVGESLLIHKLVKTREEYEQRVDELLRMVDLDPSMKNRVPHEFSGGQRQRIGIARALSSNPDLIICDEPISALDVSIQAQIINLLEELQAKLGLTYLFIAHDLAVVKHISDRILVMYLGRIVEIAECEELYNNTLHPYTKVLLGAVPVADPKVEKTRERVEIRGEVPSLTNRPAGCPFSDRCSYATERCKKEVPTLKDIGNGHEVACFLYE